MTTDDSTDTLLWNPEMVRDRNQMKLRMFMKGRMVVVIGLMRIDLGGVLRRDDRKDGLGLHGKHWNMRRRGIGNLGSQIHISKRGDHTHDMLTILGLREG